jgi:hypothetical protein
MVSYNFILTVVFAFIAVAYGSEVAEESNSIHDLIKADANTEFEQRHDVHDTITTLQQAPESLEQHSMAMRGGNLRGSRLKNLQSSPWVLTPYGVVINEPDNSSRRLSENESKHLNNSNAAALREEYAIRHLDSVVKALLEWITRK